MKFYNSLFHIPKSELSSREIARELRIHGKTTDYGENVIDLWSEDKDYWKVPLSWAFDKEYVGEDHTYFEDRVWPENECGYKNDQEKCLKEVVDGLEKHKVCRFVGPTSYGKTFLALHVAQKLKTNCLILVPSNEILEQFEETCKDFNVDYGLIKGAKQQTDKLVVLTTYQTMYRRLKKGIELKFGCTIIDEGHRCAAPTFYEVFSNMNSKYRLSVSAKFDRNDGLHKVHELCLGPIISTGIISDDNKLEKFVYAPILEKLVAMNKCRNYKGDFQHVKYLNQLAANPNYNQYIVELCDKLLKYNRRILIALKRIDQVNILHEMLGEKSGKFTGLEKKKELTLSAQKDILLYTKAHEGLDMSKFIGKDIEKTLNPLNTLIIAYPLPDCLQICGRVGREAIGERPLIVHIYSDDYYSKAKFKSCMKKTYDPLGLKFVTNLDKFLEGH